MGKIKLNLVSGAVVEKPLINAFKANESNYVVLDNEMNGSMGLPIILVCKLENNRLIKIVDQGEWQIVKEYLKNIIAGNQIEYIKIGSEVAADDIYYTQLTLPVPSFDALKNAYKIEEDVTTNIMDIPVEPVVSTSVVEAVTPVTPQVEIPVVEAHTEVQNEMNPSVPGTDITMPEIPANNNPSVDIAAPSIDLDATMPIFGAPSNPESVAEANEETTKIPAEAVDLFKEQKEAFMLACENMFDALVQKFQKELENRK